MKKRLFGMLVILCMVLTMLPTAVFADECEHSYDYAYLHSDEEGHYAECDYCDYYDESTFAPHSDEDNNEHCDFCHYATGNTHYYEHGYYNYDEYGHYKECDYCDYCDESSFALHIDENVDGYCDVCPFYQCIVHCYDTGYYHSEPAGHYKECDNCQYYDKDSFEYHIDADGDSECDVCHDYVCTHSFDVGYLYSTAEGHYAECDHCSYHDESTFEPHIDEDGDAHCDLCYYADDDGHIFEEGNYIPILDGHAKACDFCGYCDESQVEPHIDEDGNAHCDLCQYADDDDHSFEEGYYIDIADGHTKLCDFCYYYDSSNYEPHIDKDGNAHCDLCFYANEEDHSFEGGHYNTYMNGHCIRCDFCYYTYDNAFEPHIDEDSDGNCDICNFYCPIPGDLNEDRSVDNKDVETLLWYTLFPEEYPLEGAMADFDHNDVVDNLDVEYLLWHTLFPQDYPLI